MQKRVTWRCRLARVVRAGTKSRAKDAADCLSARVVREGGNLGDVVDVGPVQVAEVPRCAVV